MAKKNIVKNVVLPFEQFVSLIARDIRNASKAYHHYRCGDGYENQRLTGASKVTRDDRPALRLTFFDSECAWLYRGCVNANKEWCCILAGFDYNFFIIKEDGEKNIIYFCDENGVYDENDSIIIYPSAS